MFNNSGEREKFPYIDISNVIAKILIVLHMLNMKSSN